MDINTPPPISTDTLISNITAVEQNKALDLDEKGELIGAGIKDNFKGKIADVLVRNGLAKSGNLGGRVATALVGKDNFELMLKHFNMRSQQGSRAYGQSVVARALKVFERIETERAGGDFAKQEVISRKIKEGFGENTRLKSLTGTGTPQGGKIKEVALAIEQSVENRDKHRRYALNTINSGQPTVTIKESYPNELRQAYRAIAAEHMTTGSADLSDRDVDNVKDMLTAGKAGKAGERALDIVDEFNHTAAFIRGKEGADADDAVAQFRAQYLTAIQNEFERQDVEEGMSARWDGKTSFPVNQEKIDNPKDVDPEAKPKKSVSYSGQAEGVAFSGGGISTRGQITPDVAEDMLYEIRGGYEDAHETNTWQLDMFAIDLARIARSEGADVEQRAEAMELSMAILEKMASPPDRTEEDMATRSAICDSYDGMLECLSAIESGAKENPEYISALKEFSQNIVSIANADISRTKDIQSNPDNHKAYFDAMEDVFMADVVDQKTDEMISQKVRKSLGPTETAHEELSDVRDKATDVLAKLNSLLDG